VATELYEVVGSILRDIAQSRCLSDLYSRDISRYYAEDRVLRSFPVPRVEISEASFSVFFAITGVSEDTSRVNIRNARLSQVFERYATEIVLAAMTKAQAIIEGIRSRADLTAEQRSAIDKFATAFMSEDYRAILRARFIRYFEENREKFVADKTFLTTTTPHDVEDFIKGLGNEPQMRDALAPFTTQEVESSLQAMMKAIQDKIASFGNDTALEDAVKWAKDFKIEVAVDADRVNAVGASVCRIDVKTTIRNYTWSKVDEDPQGFASLRTLQPE
jgi:hypothetical protein